MHDGCWRTWHVVRVVVAIPASLRDPQARDPARSFDVEGDCGGARWWPDDSRAATAARLTSARAFRSCCAMVRKRTRHDDHRGGVDLVIRYDRAEQAFVGTVHDTTAEPIADVRVEVHLSSGVELGPTPRRDLAPGATGTVRLDAPGQMFDRWSVHVEIGQSEVPVLPTLALAALAALLVAGGARRLTTAATIAVLMFAVGCGDSPTEPWRAAGGPGGGGGGRGGRRGRNAVRAVRDSAGISGRRRPGDALLGRGGRVHRNRDKHDGRDGS